jgi:signal transduction histidine kinase
VRIGDTSLPGRVAASGVPALVPRVDQEAFLAASRPEYRAHLAQHPIGSVMVVPLRAGERIVGTVTATRPPGRRAFDEDDQRLLHGIAERAGLAVENACLFATERRSNQLLQDAVRLREDFLATAGHELRTPVTALLLQVQTLLLDAREGHGAAPARLEERLARTETQVLRLTALIEQLLDVGRLASGRLLFELAPVRLVDVLADVVERFHARVEVDADPAIVGRWDRLRLDQVITNLVSNALKYGAGKPVRVRARQDGPLVSLEVEDQGIGIPAEAQGRIFERFERAVAQGHYGGMGLGLWITRQLVEAMGGAIDLSSAPGEGSTFTVRLPIATPTPTP